MKDLGEANHILDMRIIPDRKKRLLYLSQKEYVHKEKGETAKIPYASACGSLMYAMVAMRPDIAHAVGVVSRFMSNPGKKHWDVVKSVLRYVSGTADRQLCYGGGELSIKGYVDSDYAGYVVSRK
ncbi:hypothetical protein L7F22_036705 [Adiantum nelumboides]|nr:hypothetical protein [Adiantum nelumboides]